MSFLQKKSNYIKCFMAGVILLLLIILLSANFGAADISFKQTATIMLSKIPIVNKFVRTSGIKETSILILINLRLPRIFLAALVGAALAVVGTSFQALFKNPMADPFVLGVSSGAALGATITMVILKEVEFIGISVVALNAFIGAVLTTFLVYNIAKVGRKVPTTTLLLAGIAINYLLSSLISLIMTFNKDDIARIVMWTMGSFSTASWNQVAFLAIVVVPATVIILMFSRDLNVMLLGEESARSLGVNVESLKKYILLLSTLIVAAVVSVSGIIGFVGLIIPHSIRMLFGADNRVVLPFSVISGAVFLILCDTLARSIVPPSEIPVGIITSIFGVPFFVYLLYKTKKKVL